MAHGALGKIVCRVARLEDVVQFVLIHVMSCPTEPTPTFYWD